MGTENKPIIMTMVPGLDSIVLKAQGEVIQKCLEKETKLFFNLTIPTNFVAIVEAFGTKRVDLALMNTYGYILARQKYKATARLIGTYKNKKANIGDKLSLVLMGPRLFKN
jgi:phosphonate transport system substrate-binding protein